MTTPNSHRSTIANTTVQPNDWLAYPHTSLSTVSDSAFCALTADSRIVRCRVTHSVLLRDSPTPPAGEESDRESDSEDGDGKITGTTKSKTKGSKKESQEKQKQKRKQKAQKLKPDIFLPTRVDLASCTLTRSTVSNISRATKSTIVDSAVHAAGRLHCTALVRSGVHGTRELKYSRLERSRVVGWWPIVSSSSRSLVPESESASTEAAANAATITAIAAPVSVIRATITESYLGPAARIKSCLLHRCSVTDCRLSKTNLTGWELRGGVWQSGRLVGPVRRGEKVVARRVDDDCINGLLEGDEGIGGMGSGETGAEKKVEGTGVEAVMGEEEQGVEMTNMTDMETGVEGGAVQLPDGTVTPGEMLPSRSVPATATSFDMAPSTTHTRSTGWTCSTSTISDNTEGENDSEVTPSVSNHRSTQAPNATEIPAQNVINPVPLPLSTEPSSSTATYPSTFPVSPPQYVSSPPSRDYSAPTSNATRGVFNTPNPLNTIPRRRPVNASTGALRLATRPNADRGHCRDSFGNTSQNSSSPFVPFQIPGRHDHHDTTQKPSTPPNFSSTSPTIYQHMNYAHTFDIPASPGSLHSLGTSLMLDDRASEVMVADDSPVEDGEKGKDWDWDRERMERDLDSVLRNGRRGNWSWYGVD